MKTGLFVLAVLGLGAAALAEDTKDTTISSNGAAVVTLTLPKTAKVTTTEDKTVIDTKELYLCVWVVPKAKTVAEAVSKVDEVIKSEFTNFAVKKTETIKVAGAEAKHLMGEGKEADDGDPGTADVVVFAVGKHVLAACVHGEGDAAARQREPLLKVLKTAKAP
jgi:hypothetical protein